ncbi:hypothetical protein [Acetivibrio ethanolgignens]|uniref:Uncharacterized protein n=1 Tax=Acetivibrio ethanolgignens TaxID=290052 RepID=A0A0V8QFC0_9FIRM|nr:hypothetical protein [Acetivibrio ethanolgignens]KSV59091.1 hypothetical protein ASU35_01885 [Acetivibrio ethanolgignens]
MKNLTLDYCYKHHKATFEVWQHGKPIASRYEGDILIIKYQSGAWFHYKLENGCLIWWKKKGLV